MREINNRVALQLKIGTTVVPKFKINRNISGSLNGCRTVVLLLWLFLYRSTVIVVVVVAAVVRAGSGICQMGADHGERVERESITAIWGRAPAGSRSRD